MTLIRRPLPKFLSKIVFLAPALLASCALPHLSSHRDLPAAKISGLDLTDVASTEHPRNIQLRGAKNEWISFQIEISELPAATADSASFLRLQAPQLQNANGSIGVDHFTVYQILPMPVDVNRAGYVRHTGLSAATRSLPRALLPIANDHGRINLDAARDPEHPTDKDRRAGQKPIQLWVDLHVPAETPAGNYATRLEVMTTGEERPIASIPVKLDLYDFVLPDERHLALVGQLDWESLGRLYPTQFEALSPKLISRSDDRCKEAVKTMDSLIKLAEAHRVEMVVPRLQPIVKWPNDRPPSVDWTNFDSVTAPWLKGDLFADKVPLNYWPLPPVDSLSNYDPRSQREYWADAAGHFDQNDWLPRAPVMLDTGKRGRLSAMEALKVSADAAGILASHTRVRVATPLEDDQVQFSSNANPSLIRPADTQRLITQNPSIVFTPEGQNWPSGVARPPRWLGTEPTGLSPYVGAGGDERDVRLWAWLSFIPLPPPQLGNPYGPVQFIRFVNALPTKSKPDQPADPNELIWCYPGSWFGVDQPLPSVQLKWLRRAQQDYEYLYLAKQRGDLVNTLLMSRLMTKPVQLQPNQQPDPTFGLMCGTADPAAWDNAIDLLAQRILLNRPGQSADRLNDPAFQQADKTLNIRMLRWTYPQERPVIAGRTTQWGFEQKPGGERQIDLRLGVDLYNASDSTPDNNSFSWTSEPANAGWQVRPQPVVIPSLATYQVRRVFIDGNIDPNRLGKPTRQPIELTFVNGYDTQKISQVRMVLPVAASMRRETMLDISDGLLDDWSEDDAIQNGPLTRMFSRPTLQAQKVDPASTDSHIYTNWADENFYMAFKVSGLSNSPTQTSRNFVSYQFRRAWGEDVCQVLVQPIYADNTLGPVLHLAFKPSGSSWLERKLDPKRFADPWVPVEGAGVRYTASLDPAAGDWRGEIAVPWKAINDEKHKELPVMLRFNFVQHKESSGESASWAGPIDFGRDDDFTGILVLKEPETPGVVH